MKCEPALKFLSLLAFAIASVSPLRGAAGRPPGELEKYDVTWASPSEDSRGSMPLGNGDIGLNVWVEKQGDLVFYLSKTDAWSDNVGGGTGLPKVGRIRVRLSPALTTQDHFLQRLRLANGEVEIGDGEVTLRVWVDANQPVIHLEMASRAPRAMEARFETTRPAPQKDLQADTLVGGSPDRLIWYYRNQNQREPLLTNRTFGAMVFGDGFKTTSPQTLSTAKPANRHELSVCVLTAQTATPEQWLEKLSQEAAQARKIPIEVARAEHAKWWNEFWNRSWIFLSGDADAEKVTQGYVLQRFVSACAGRGAYPIKFNGSIFTMDWQKTQKIKGVETTSWMPADARDWGGQYWFQNTRPMYWPMLQSGDFDLMQPLFKMFREILPRNEKEVREFYQHEGAYFAETKSFAGGINKLAPDAPGKYTDFYYTPILELSAMMLDHFDYTGDKKFARETLLPIADAGMKFFDQHWKRENGKLLLDPDNAIEMFWKARNPAPDIAGLRWVLPKLLALPAELTTEEQRGRWQRFLGELPPLPSGEVNGVKVLLPAEVSGPPHNRENPELYSIFPFRIFGLHKPGLEMATATFAARRFKDNGCWRQNGIQAALLGDTETARQNVVFVLQRTDPQCRFPAFWAHGSDYVPDEDNGGNGLNALQAMLMQSEGQKIYLLPAWPKAWSAKFKLRAPFDTVVEGTLGAGQIQSLAVTPVARKKDVVLSGAEDRACP